MSIDGLESVFENQFSGDSLGFIEELYGMYLTDPSTVDSDWRAFFDDLPIDAGLTAAELAGPQKSAAPSSGPVAMLLAPALISLHAKIK